MNNELVGRDEWSDGKYKVVVLAHREESHIKTTTIVSKWNAKRNMFIQIPFRKIPMYVHAEADEIKSRLKYLSGV